MRIPALLLVFLLLPLLGITITIPARAGPFQIHEPIEVNRDTGPEGWAACACTSPGGDGTPGNPYIIENYEIISSPSTIDNGSIHISNTVSHFIIRNVYIHPTALLPGPAGMLFDNVSNARIENNTVTNTQYGIWLAFTTGTMLVDNHVYANRIGIYVTGGSENSILNNRASDNFEYGVWMASTSNNLVRGNTSVNSLAGFIVGSSTGNTFESNFASNHTDDIRRGYGFRVLFSTGNTFRNNTVTKVPFGLIFEFSSGNLAIENKLSENDYGIGLERGNTANTVTRNNVTGNSYGVYVFSSPRNLVYDNYLQNNLNAYDDVSFPVHLTVTDDTGVSTTTNLPVTMALPPPLITQDFTFSPSSPAVEESVTFSATASGGTTPYRFDWNFGDSGVATGQTTAHTYSSTGFFPVTLQVTDNSGFTANTLHYVSVESGLVTDFTYTPTQTAPYSFSLTASASGGTPPYTFAWDFRDERTGTGTSVAHTFSSADFTHWNTTRTLGTNILGGPFIGGNYYSDYQGTDSDLDGIGDTPYTISGEANRDQLPLVPPVSLTVHDVAVTSLTAQPASVRMGGMVTITVAYSNRGTVAESFDITVFYDQTPIGEARHIANMPESTQGTLAVLWNTQGVPAASYVIRAVASSVPDEANTGNNEFLLPGFTVLPNQAPVAMFSYVPETPLLGNTVTFTSTSTDDGTIASYLWDFGDGAIATGPSASHVYTSATTYTATLNVTDEHGATSSASRTVIVRPNYPSQPTDFEMFGTQGVVLLTWGPPDSNGGAPITGYRIYRGESPEKIGLLASVGNTTSYVDNSVAGGKTYYYFVVAVNGNAEEGGEPSLTRDVLVPFSNTSGVPGLPGNLTAWAALVSVVVAATVAIVVFRRRKHP